MRKRIKGQPALVNEVVKAIEPLLLDHASKGHTIHLAKEPRGFGMMLICGTCDETGSLFNEVTPLSHTK